MTKTKTRTPLVAMRKNCIECAGDNRKFVKFCTCDGLHSTRCEFWAYRFGKRPQTIHDQRLVIPECMPSANTLLEDVSEADLKPLPAGVVRRKRTGRKMTDEQKRALRERFDRGRRKPR